MFWSSLTRDHAAEAPKIPLVERPFFQTQSQGAASRSICPPKGGNPSTDISRVFNLLMERTKQYYTMDPQVVQGAAWMGEYSMDTKQSQEEAGL